jgi:hypothetical protein
MVHTKQKAGWTPQQGWKILEKRKSLVPAGIRTPDRPSSYSLYRLFYGLSATRIQRLITVQKPTPTDDRFLACLKKVNGNGGEWRLKYADGELPDVSLEATKTTPVNIN